MKSEIEHARAVAPTDRNSYVNAFRRHALAALDEAARAAQERGARSACLPSGVVDPESVADGVAVQQDRAEAER